MTALLTHRLQGHGEEVVVLLNGGMMTHSSWAPIAEELLNSGYRVLGCDFRGQLLTPRPAPERIEDHAPDVLALLDALDIDRPHLLGTSYGGEVGLVAASSEPDRFRSLAVVTAVDRTPPGMAESSRHTQGLVREILNGESSRRFRDDLLESFYSVDYRRSHAEELERRQRQTAELPHSWYEGLLGILASLEDFDLTPRLGDITAPTLVVHAALDAVMPAERVKALAQGIPGARLQIHGSSGHALVVEDPKWLAETYLEFLSGLGGRNARGQDAQGQDARGRDA
ncbi:MAG: alpha/beta fold hydrolase [Acidobacteriota bacterium]